MCWSEEIERLANFDKATNPGESARAGSVSTDYCLAGRFQFAHDEQTHNSLLHMKADTYENGAKLKEKVTRMAWQREGMSWQLMQLPGNDHLGLAGTIHRCLYRGVRVSGCQVGILENPSITCFLSLGFP
jgi:hypothetical protein